MPADRFIKEWFRERRFAGSGDRRAISEFVFGILRQRVGFAWRMKDGSPRALVIAALLAEGGDPETLFTGGYGPPPLTQAERDAIVAHAARCAAMGAEANFRNSWKAN